MRRKRIGVAPSAMLASRAALFALWRAVYEVEFVEWEPSKPAGYDGLMVFEASDKERESALKCGVESLVVPRYEGPGREVKKGSVEFEGSDLVDVGFRGQRMLDECIREAPLLRCDSDEELICTLDGEPYWSVKRAGSVRHVTVALAPPTLEAGQTVYDCFNRRRWLQMLPFLDFLKQLTCGGWTPPPARACLMFDDPNLHWWKYGFIDFRQLVRHAVQCNYHATFAMVPLDAWFVHNGVASFFRQNRSRVSLCMHGINHTAMELGAELDARALESMLAQGLRKMEDFERRSGLSVARVIVPPYGAFRSPVAGTMQRLGYEGACVSRSSLLHWNKGRDWPRSFGHSASEFVEGLPIVPRHVLSRGHEGSYRLAAFLNQPIIPHGHHQDCAPGLELLAEVAASINGLGNVVWADMTSIFRSSYLTRREGKTLFVRMLTRRVNLALEDCSELVIERPWLLDRTNTEPLIVQGGERVLFSGECNHASGPIAVAAGGRVEVVASSPDPLDYRAVKSPRVRTWPVLRRVASEARDRLVSI